VLTQAKKICLMVQAARDERAAPDPAGRQAAAARRRQLLLPGANPRLRHRVANIMETVLTFPSVRRSVGGTLCTL
jgi:hypothetical protein